MEFKFKNNKAFSLIELSIVLIIIGLLVFGVTSGRTLMKSARIRGARLLTMSAPVAQIEDLVLWLEPSMDGSFVDSSGVDVVYGSAIYEWKNKAGLYGFSPSVIQATSSYQPLLIEEGANKLPTVRFDGTNDSLTKTGQLIEEAGTNTIFVVFSPSSFPGQGMLFGQFLYGSGQSASSNHYIAVNSNSTLMYDQYGPGGKEVIPSTTMTANTAYVATVTYDYQGSTTAQLNGAGTATIASSEIYNGSQVDIMSLGASMRNVVPSAVLTGDISEVIVYDRVLSDDEIDSIESYLSQKYKIR